MCIFTGISHDDACICRHIFLYNRIFLPFPSIVKMLDIDRTCATIFWIVPWLSGSQLFHLCTDLQRLFAWHPNSPEVPTKFANSPCHSLLTEKTNTSTRIPIFEVKEHFLFVRFRSIFNMGDGFWRLVTNPSWRIWVSC